MTVLFADHFWGEKHVGLTVLWASLKSGTGSVKELSDWLKERASLAEESAKHEAKSLARAATFATADAHTTKSAWLLTRNALERLQQGQARLAVTVQELAKEVGKYSDELSKSHREVKSGQAPSFESANLMQTTTTCLQKSRETYATRCVEVEKLRRDQAPPKDIAKAEKRRDKAKEEYRLNVEKYEDIRQRFTSAMEDSAGKFQEAERQHLDRMRQFMANYAKQSSEAHSMAAQVCEELCGALRSLDVDTVLGELAEKKGTGTERPGVIAFEEPDMDALLPPPPPPPPSQPPPPPAQPTNGIPSSQSQPVDAAAKWNAGSVAEGDLLHLGADDDGRSVASSNSSSNKEDGGGTASRSKLRLHLGGWNSKKERSSPAPNTTTPADASLTTPTATQSQPESSGSALLSIDDESTEEPSTPVTASPRLVHSLKAPLPPTASLPAPLRPSRLPSSASFSASPAPLQPPPNLPDDSSGPVPANQSSVRPRIAVSLSPAQLRLRRSHTFASPPQPSALPRPKDQPAAVSQRQSKPAVPAVPAVPASNQNKRMRSSLSFSKGFFKNRKGGKKKSATKLDGDLSKFPPEKTAEAGGESNLPRVDDEGFIIREEEPTPAPLSSKKDSDSSSDDDDDTPRRIHVEIKPVGTIKASASTNGPRLSDVVAQMSQSASTLPPPPTAGLPTILPSLPAPLPKSRTMDERDPWAPASSTMGAPPRVPLRPSLTGDGRLSANEEEVVDAITEASEAAFEKSWFEGDGEWPLAPSLTGSSSRPRPRPTTPTNFFSLGGGGEGGGSFSRSESLASLSEDSSVLGGSQYFPNQGAKLPLAMALTETVHAIFAGTEPNKHRIRVFGSVHVSFPGTAMSTLTSESPPPPLTFRLINANKLQALIPNKQVLSSASAFASAPVHEVIFDPAGLGTQLKKLAAARPGAPFYNLEVLRYEVRTPTPPLLLQLWWKAEAATADLRIDYRLNPDNAFTKAVLNPTFTTGLGGGRASGVVARPDAELVPDGTRLIWRLTTLSSLGEEAEAGAGSLKARLTVETGPLTPAPTALTFSIPDTTLSGAALEVNHEHYRLSLLKKKTVSGKYTVEKASS